MKTRIHELLEKGLPGDRLSHYVDVFLVILIITNIAAVIMETCYRSPAWGRCSLQ